MSQVAHNADVRKMCYRTILFEKKREIAKITLNRPSLLNAINYQMMDELTKALEEAAKDPTVRVLIIRGAGRSFSSGADLKEMQDLLEDSRKNVRRIERLLLGRRLTIQRFSHNNSRSDLRQLACDVRVNNRVN